LDQQIRRNHKSEILRLIRSGWTTSIDDWSLYERFITIYWETMERVNADEGYYFDTGYFHELKAVLGSRLHLISALTPDGEMAAGGLFTTINGIMQYHLSGTAEAHRLLAPSKLVAHAAIMWGKAAGNRVLHLGGGVGGKEDSLFQFKAGFSNGRLAFQTWRIICDSVKYSALAPSGCADSCTESFFPSYRAPGNAAREPQLSLTAS
jgi:hypothetical protein